MNSRSKIRYVVFTIVAIVLMPNSFAHSDDLNFDNTFSLMISHYQYKEPDFMRISAVNIGADYIATLTSDRGWFMRGDIIAAVSAGTHYDSNSTGTMDDFPNRYFDI